jgi:hypothetical protein
MDLRKSTALIYGINILDDIRSRSIFSREKYNDVFCDYLNHYYTNNKLDQTHQDFITFIDIIKTTQDYKTMSYLSNAVNDDNFCDAIIEFYLSVYMGQVPSKPIMKIYKN